MSSPATQPAEAPSELQSSPQPVDWQRWGELTLVLLITIAPSILSASFALSNPITRARSEANVGLIIGILHQVTGVLLVIYVLSRRGLNLKNLGLDFSRWTDWVIGLGLALGATFVTAVITVLIRRYGAVVTGHNPDIRDPRVIFAGVSTIQLLIYSACSAVFEETIVRGYVTTELVGLGWPIWFGSGISVLLQTSYHVYYGLEGAVLVSGYFIVFAFYFAISRRLLPVIVGHLLVDFAAIGFNHLR